MKWSHFIKDDNKATLYTSGYRLRSSKRVKTQMPELSIKSIQKIKMEMSTSSLFHDASPSSKTYRENKIKNIINKHISQQTVRHQTNQFQTSPYLQISQYPLYQYDLNEILEQFKKEFSHFIQIFLAKVQSIINHELIKKELNTCILRLSQQIIQTCFEPEIHTIKRPKSFFQNISLVTTHKNSETQKSQQIAVINDTSNKKKAKNFFKLEQSIEKACKILDKQKKPPRFSRKSKLQTDISLNGSIQSQAHQNIQQSSRMNRNKMKSKEVLYKMNKMLNQ